MAILQARDNVTKFNSEVKATSTNQIYQPRWRTMSQNSIVKLRQLQQIKFINHVGFSFLILSFGY